MRFHDIHAEATPAGPIITGRKNNKRKIEGKKGEHRGKYVCPSPHPFPPPCLHLPLAVVFTHRPTICLRSKSWLKQLPGQRYTLCTSTAINLLGLSSWLMPSPCVLCVWCVVCVVCVLVGCLCVGWLSVGWSVVCVLGGCLCVGRLSVSWLVGCVLVGCLCVGWLSAWWASPGPSLKFGHDLMQSKPLCVVVWAPLCRNHGWPPSSKRI
jgi:hypothetical protein